MHVHAGPDGTARPGIGAQRPSRLTNYVLVRNSFAEPVTYRNEKIALDALPMTCPQNIIEI